jgi:predicted MFS family arabinose efflux permease
MVGEPGETAAPAAGAPARPREQATAAAGPAPVARQVLPLLSLAGFLVSMDARVIATILPQVAGDFGASVPAAGAAMTAYLLPYGFFQLAYGPLADRVGAMRVISLAIVGFALGVTASALAPTLPALVALRFVTGAVAAAIIPLALATIGNLTPYAGRQAAIATLLGATATGQVLSAAIGGVLAEVLSWRAIFLIDGALAVLLTLPLWRRRQATPPLAIRRAGHPFTAHLALLRDRRALALYGAVLLEGAFLNGGSTYLGGLLRERDGLSYLLIGLVLSLFGLATLLISRGLGRLGRRIGENRLILGGGLLMGVAYWLIGLLRDPAATALAVFVLGAGFTLCHSTFQTRGTELQPAARATAISLFAFALFLGGGLGTALLGLLLTAAGYTPVLLLCGLGLALLGLLAPRLTAPKPA